MEQRIEPGGRNRWILLWIHRLLLIAGGILLAYYGFMRVSGWAFSQAGLYDFDLLRSASFLPHEPADHVDFSLWSEQRIHAYMESLELKKDPALAVLKLDRLKIRVPVFEGTDELTLNRGAGWIHGTARPGEKGNVAIAAHRDGFFRALKDVAVGDLIELQLPHRTAIYRVKKTEIINPDEIRVLMPGTEPMLTLVTCYPFYYVGSAPQRFIVQATISEIDSISTDQDRAGKSSSNDLMQSTTINLTRKGGKSCST